jgi:hypothetical protein
LKHHLDGGIRKGALTQEQADAKLAAWLEAKSGTVDAKKDGLTKAQADKAKAFKAEQDVNAKRLAAAAEADACCCRLLLKKLLKSLKLKLQLKKLLLQKKTTKKLKHKFISEDA